MINCSKHIGDRSRFYHLHCLSPSSSLSGDILGACSVACFPTNSEAPQAPLFFIKHCATYIALARARARRSVTQVIHVISDNIDYVNYDVDMLYLKHRINRYADQVQDAVVLQPKKLANWLKIPPHGLQRPGGVLVLVHTQSASNFAPHPMFCLNINQRRKKWQVDPRESAF